MKKMTQKEFFEVLKNAGCYAENFDDVLNIISAHSSMCARDAANRGFAGAEKMYRKESDYIYDYLDSRHYYDSIKNNQ